MWGPAHCAGDSQGLETLVLGDVQNDGLLAAPVGQETQGGPMTEHEAKAWKALAATYAQCVELAIQQWDGLIGLASMAQQKMAEDMRDRCTSVAVHADAPPTPFDRAIPVPLFTHRDRLQFLKEVSVTLLIEASKRGLSVTEPEDVGPPVVPFGKQKGTPLDKVPGIDLQSMLDWVAERPDRGAKYAEFVAAGTAEIAKRVTHVDEVTGQPLDEKPLALVTEDRP